MSPSRVRSVGLRQFTSLGTVIAVTLTARASLADHYRVPSGSMEPTVQVGDHLVVSKLAYGVRWPLSHRWLVTFDGPKRGDIVVLDPPDEPPAAIGATEVLLKRVVALAGDEVAVRSGHVLLGGHPARDANASLAHGGGPDFGAVRVPADQVLVLGDNRGNSRDGRTFGFVPVARVLGRAEAVIKRGGAVALTSLR